MDIIKSFRVPTDEFFGSFEVMLPVGAEVLIARSNSFGSFLYVRSRGDSNETLPRYFKVVCVGGFIECGGKYLLSFDHGISNYFLFEV